MNNIDEGYLSIINDNDNVSETNDFKEFFLVFGGIISLCTIIFLLFNFLSNIYIKNISPSQQIKLEQLISQNSKLKNLTYSDGKYNSQIIYLEKIKKEIIKNDTNIQNRSNLDLHIIKSKELNAFVTPDGNIFFTTGLLDKISDKQELAFVLAHELGHYSHRDNLKAFSRQISLVAIASVFSIGQNNTVNKTIKGLGNFTDIKYSQKQEFGADIYASNSIKKIYGTNIGAIDFFKTLQKEDKNPDFIYLFADHPKTKDRMKTIQIINNMHSN